jgi:biopolymer transport protein ExbB
VAFGLARLVLREGTNGGAGCVAHGDETVMNIVERSKDLLLDVGASPIMYLMIALSVVSAAIILERLFFFLVSAGKVERLAQDLTEHLDRGDVAGAARLAIGSRSAEAAIVAAGLKRFDHGAAAVEEAMTGATVLQRMRLERGLAFLGTLGNNAPFVGLLGTVIGIVQAFESLERAGLAAGGAGAEVMGAIAEALVATAIGLAVAIPAVAAFNYFQRRIKAILGNSAALTHVLLSHMKSEKRAPNATADAPSGAQPDDDDEPSGVARLSVAGA